MINFHQAGYRAGLLNLGLLKLADEVAPAQPEESHGVGSYVLPGAAALLGAAALYGGHRHLMNKGGPSGGTIVPGGFADRYQKGMDALRERMTGTELANPTNMPTVGKTEGAGLQGYLRDLFSPGAPGSEATRVPGSLKDRAQQMVGDIKDRFTGTELANPTNMPTVGKTKAPGLGTQIGDLMSKAKDRMAGYT